MKLRFYIDLWTNHPHIYKHEVTSHYLCTILAHPSEDRLGHEGSRVAIGQTRTGRHLRVIYVQDKEPDSIFVITAYDLLGKTLIAYRRRMRRRKK